jgi:hypothetical protein
MRVLANHVKVVLVPRLRNDWEQNGFKIAIPVVDAGSMIELKW